VCSLTPRLSTVICAWHNEIVSVVLLYYRLTWPLWVFRKGLAVQLKGPVHCPSTYKLLPLNLLIRLLSITATTLTLGALAHITPR